jgi:UDP-N-acetyl-D-glucosamine dehydrogenase
VIRLLEHRGAVVSFHDPHVPVLREDGMELSSVPLSADVLAGADCVIIVTDHSAVDYDLVARHAPIVVDTRRALRRTRP